jgi:outer membrane receptor for ferrienterochelin and colicins
MNRSKTSTAHALRHGSSVASRSQTRRAFLRAMLLLRMLSGIAHAQSELTTELPPPPISEENIIFQDIPSVYSASKYDQKVTEAPSSVTIITADEIQKYGYRTLADILQSVNGFFVTSDRNYSYLGVRGFNRPGDFNTRILLLIDGHRLNDNNYDQAGLGTESVVDVDLIDRVEIVRGPSSSLYGTNAFFGAINVITKRGRDIRGLEVSGEYGSFQSYKGRVTYGNRFQNGLELLLSTSFYDSHGHRRLFFREFAYPSTNNGFVRNSDDDRFPYFFAKASFADFSLQGGFLSREKGLPTAPFGTVFNTTRTRTVDEHGYVDLKYDHEFANQLGLSTRLYYDRFYFRGDFLYDDENIMGLQPVLNQDVGLGEWWGGELKLTKRLWQRHKVTGGIEYRDNFRQDLSNANTNPFESLLNVQKSSHIWAFYFQDEFSLLDNLILNAGVRYDHYSTFGGTVNPRLALIYNLKNTSLKILYGEAFRAPSVFEGFYTGTNFKQNPHLKPESITTYELVLEHYFNKYLRSSIAGYYYTIDGLISEVTEQEDDKTFNIFRNAESVEAKGVELLLEGKWPSGIETRLAYALQETENQDTKEPLTNSPHHLVKGSLIVPLLSDQVFASLEARYVSQRRSPSEKIVVSDFFSTNFTLFSQNIIKNMEASLSFSNLFDQRYGDPVSDSHQQAIIEQDGRTFWIKLKYGF